MGSTASSTDRSPPRPARSAAPVRDSDAALVELLRTEELPGVGDLAAALGVTATAVRQRLDRLMRVGVVAREVIGAVPGDGAGIRPRGRPAFGYRLTESGRRTGGDNFRDLAMVLWKEVRAVDAPEVRRGLVSRIGSAMARLYRENVHGADVTERLERTAALFRDRDIACVVEPADAASGQPAVLTTHVCPYPDLAEDDRGICSAERLMLQDLMGSQVTLSACRLDGADCCRFTVAAGPGKTAVPRQDSLPTLPCESGQPESLEGPSDPVRRSPHRADRRSQSPP